MPQLTALNANITGNASGFVGASKLAAFELNKLKAAASAAKREAEALAAANNTLEKRFERMKMATDTAYAGLVNFNKAQQLAKDYATQHAWSQAQLDAEIVRLANHFGVAEFQGRKFGEGVKSARFHSANLAAQFNDIGVMMASGQSPFILAMQQGTQISQVFNAMGGTVKEQMAVLRSSFLSVINPTSLITIGVIALGAAFVQWVMSMKQADEQIEKTKTRQEEYKTVIDELKNSIISLRIEQEKLADVTLSSEQIKAQWELNRLKLEEQVLTAELVSLNQQANETMSQTLSDQIQAKANEIAANREAQAKLDKQIEFNKRLTATLEAQKLIKAGGDELIAVMNTISNTDIAGPFWKLLAPLDAAIAKAKAFASEWGMASGPAGKRINGLTKDNVSLFGKVPDSLNPSAMPTSPRPQQPPSGEGGVDWGTSNQGGGGGGGESIAEKIQKELEQLQQSLMTQEQLEMESYARRQELLKSALDQRLITQQQYSDMMAQIEATHNFAMLKQSNANVRGVLGNLQTVFQGSKKIGAAIALANSYLAFTEVLKDPAYIGRPFARFAAAAAALTSGLQAVRSIKSASPGGSGGSISTGGAGATGGGEGQATRQQSVVLQLSGGDMFSRPQIISLINAINEASEDGARIRVA